MFYSLGLEYLTIKRESECRLMHWGLGLGFLRRSELSGASGLCVRKSCPFSYSIHVNHIHASLTRSLHPQNALKDSFEVRGPSKASDLPKNVMPSSCPSSLVAFAVCWRFGLYQGLAPQV